MNKKIKLSVIVPVYKVENYLHKCVDSILGQTYKALEIILVDDGSPDKCGKICDEYAVKDERIKVIHKSNGGLSDARNAGIEVAEGEYITFVDSDDWIEKDMYEILMKGATENSTKLAVGGVKVYDEAQAQYRQKYDKIVISERIISKEKYMKEVFLGIWAAWDKIYHRSLFENVRFPLGEFNEDEAIMLEIMDQCEKVYVTNAPLYVHFVRANESLTAANFSERKMDWYTHCKENLRFIEQKYPTITKEAEYRYFMSLIWCLNNMTKEPERYKKYISILKKELRGKISKVMRNDYILPKEKIRSIFIAFAYGVYVKIVKLLGKEFT